MRITYGCCSDRGDVRTENQDRVLALSGEVEGKEAGLFVLADGMGGLEHGSSVSTYITDEFLKWWEEDFPQMAHAGKCEKEEIRELLEQMDRILELEKAYGAPFREDGQRLSALLSSLRSGDWDSCCAQLQTFSFGRLGALRGFEDDELKKSLQSRRDQIKKIIKGLAQRQFCADAGEFREDIYDLRPKVSTLF